MLLFSRRPVLTLPGSPPPPRGDSGPELEESQEGDESQTRPRRPPRRRGRGQPPSSPAVFVQLKQTCGYLALPPPGGKGQDMGGVTDPNFSALGGES